MESISISIRIRDTGMTRWDSDLSQDGNQAKLVKKSLNEVVTEILFLNKTIAYNVYQTEKLTASIITYSDYTGYQIHQGGTQYPQELRGINIQALSSVSSPVIKNASIVTSTSFISNWSLLPKVIYSLDVSTSVSFSSYVGIYHNYEIINSNNFKLVIGLISNTDYYYRVRTKTTWNEYSNYTQTMYVKTL